MIIYRYADGTTKRCTYRDITVMENGKLKWNYALLRTYAEPQRPVEITCTCRGDDQGVAMHFKERPTGSRHYHLATNAKLKHHENCPKRRIFDEITTPPKPTKSAVQFRNDGEKTIVNVSINLFGGGIQESEHQSEVSTGGRVSPINASRSTSEDMPSKRRSRRGQAHFGGLIREWYLLGRSFAKEQQKHTNISRRNILHGMWRVMLDAQMEIGNDRDGLKKHAYVPHKSIEYFTEGEQRVIVGLFNSMDVPTWGEKVIHLSGINTSWPVIVPAALNATIPTYSERHLIAVRAVRRNASWRLTHTPFAVILADPDAMWVESNTEAEAYAMLSKTRFSVDKPLRVMEELEGLRPDFVLRGLKCDVMVEIYGRTGDSDYDDHKKDKQNLYNTLQHEGLIEYLEWDLSLPHGRMLFVNHLKELSQRL